MGSLPPLRMNSPRYEDSLVTVEAIDFAKTIASHFASLLRVAEKMNRREIQKTSGKKKPCLCLHNSTWKVVLSKSFPNAF